VSAACDHHSHRTRGRAPGEPGRWSYDQGQGVGGACANQHSSHVHALTPDDQKPALADDFRRLARFERRMTRPGGIRLLIADDDAVARDALSERFSREQDIDVIAVAADGHEAVRMAGERSPDVVLTEVTMGGPGGVGVARQIRAVSPNSKVVMLTSLSDHQTILDSIDSGAVGYMFKDEDDDAVVRAVRAAFRGESPLSARAATAILSSRVAPRSSAMLTDREL
jgi:DNA-binding NarL/FixJ family response regulator